jgi:uncharacterized membrane protein
MNGFEPVPRQAHALGCLGMALILAFFCLLPLLFFQAMEDALVKLHLDRTTALLIVLGILAGSVVNIPVWRVEREGEQIVEMIAIFGLSAWMPRLRRVRRDTVIAVNVGGCVIPVALAVWQMSHLIEAGGRTLAALTAAATANVAVCFLVARPVAGVGIVMPGFLSPLTAVGVTWLLLMPESFAAVRPPVAFVSGVLGPLVGADLLHLKDITKVPMGMLSIGGAGTFDGIVLSGILAALLA